MIHFPSSRVGSEGTRRRRRYDGNSSWTVGKSVKFPLPQLTWGAFSGGCFWLVTLAIEEGRAEDQRKGTEGREGGSLVVVVHT